MARYPSFDVNVGVVVGARGVLVIDTRCCEPEGRELLADLRRVSTLPVLGVVHTHWHFDHTFGTAALRDAFTDVPVHAHEEAAETLRATGPALQDQARAEAAEPVHAEIAAARLVIPDRPFASVRSVDLGDRVVEIAHLGRGHTSGDAVVRVADADTDVVYMGDLVESATRSDATPGFGDDSFPLEWGDTLERVGSLLTGDTVVVPGHGAPVDRDFVDQQQHDIADVAGMIRSLAGQGVPVAEALKAGGEMTRPAPLAQQYGVEVPAEEIGSQAADRRGWPFDPAYLDTAVRRGYEHLGVADVAEDTPTS